LHAHHAARWACEPAAGQKAPVGDLRTICFESCRAAGGTEPYDLGADARVAPVTQREDAARVSCLCERDRVVDADLAASGVDRWLKRLVCPAASNVSSTCPAARRLSDATTSRRRSRLSTRARMTCSSADAVAIAGAAIGRIAGCVPGSSAGASVDGIEVTGALAAGSGVPPAAGGATGTSIVKVLVALIPWLPAVSACRARAVYVPFASALAGVADHAPSAAAVVVSTCWAVAETAVPANTSTVTVARSPAAMPALAVKVGVALGVRARRRAGQA